MTSSEARSSEAEDHQKL